MISYILTGISFKKCVAEVIQIYVRVCICTYVCVVSINLPTNTYTGMYVDTYSNHTYMTIANQIIGGFCLRMFVYDISLFQTYWYQADTTFIMCINGAIEVRQLKWFSKIKIAMSKYRHKPARFNTIQNHQSKWQHEWLYIYTRRIVVATFINLAKGYEAQLGPDWKMM